MPLLPPGMEAPTAQSVSGQPSNNSSSSAQSWMSKLAGKTLGSSHTETEFAKKDLPKEHRVLNEGDMRSMDFKKDRINVHLDSDGKVKHVTEG